MLPSRCLPLGSKVRDEEEKSSAVLVKFIYWKPFLPLRHLRQNLAKPKILSLLLNIPSLLVRVDREISTAFVTFQFNELLRKLRGAIAKLPQIGWQSCPIWWDLNGDSPWHLSRATASPWFHFSSRTPISLQSWFERATKGHQIYFPAPLLPWIWLYARITWKPWARTPVDYSLNWAIFQGLCAKKS
jgi:hypothetical protein